MSIDWSPLRSELRQWRREDLTLQLWWRDDDAVAATPQLDRLARLAETTKMHVHLAIIPQRLQPSLIEIVGTAPFIPVTHGWAHTNHAPDGAKSAEFGHVRYGAGKEITDGIEKLRAIFGSDLCPMFVPPWNRIQQDYFPLLAAAGYEALSTYGPRSAPGAGGLKVINTHIDPIDWRGTRGLVQPDTLVARLVETLSDRRQGISDNTEPLGLLTHHLVHDEEIWDFCDALMSELAPIARTSASQLF